MATNRSRRLRKKLCVDEFQELGFELNLNFKDGLSEEAIDAFLEAFLRDAMTGNGLGYVGGDDYGLVCLAKRGSVSEEQRAAVEGWLKGRSELADFSATALMDVWYPENPINPA
ncbi:YggL family protein [Phytopseudomonas dryadis]|uniref:DUF469 domain-containing protein n=1 Tax=Phytopseudomonas dryadis TaxID=2487520 RepID=A0A4Q9R672_9GAMM|nr:MULTISPECIES: YggL family protein [Pseudomonas]TBU95444.1 hypothetical protein DNK44_07755 [Pseudomonas dryadis]TBV03815.1 hypothetical protein DNK34_15925 [Pseudomonas dryadis]TBV16032.1 hypothetical protein DNK41_16490 [Pseudomonas sp. FRB 230]